MEDTSYTNCFFGTVCCKIAYTWNWVCKYCLCVRTIFSGSKNARGKALVLRKQMDTSATKAFICARVWCRFGSPRRPRFQTPSYELHAELVQWRTLIGIGFVSSCQLGTFSCSLEHLWVHTDIEIAVFFAGILLLLSGKAAKFWVVIRGLDAYTQAKINGKNRFPPGEQSMFMLFASAVFWSLELGHICVPFASISQLYALLW